MATAAIPSIDQESKPSVITPKIEPLPYYPAPVGGSAPHVIKEMKPTVSMCHLDDLACWARQNKSEISRRELDIRFGGRVEEG